MLWPPTMITVAVPPTSVAESVFAGFCVSDAISGCWARYYENLPSERLMP